MASVEIAGVAAALRDAFRRRGQDAQLWVIVPHPFARAEDRLITGYWARTRAALVAPFQFDVLHFHAGNTLLEYIDVLWARVMPARRRPVMLMHYWGDDVRMRLATGTQRPIGADDAWESAQRRSERLMKRRLRIAARLVDAAIVSDLELAGHARRWFRTVYVVPTPLDLRALPEAPASRRPGPLRVLHAPSDQLVKGTAVISDAIETASKERVIEKVFLSGVPRAEVLDHIADADLVIDQLNSQTTGVLALESMAIGRPVLVQYELQLLAPFARDTPAVPITAETVSSVLETLLEDEARRVHLGAEGHAFARRVHDSDVVAAALEHVYAHAHGAPAGLFVATPDGVRPLASVPE
jgi:hypothetical protein